MTTDGLTPLSALTFLGAVLGIGAAVFLAAFSLVLGRSDVAKVIAGLAIGGVGLYAGLLVVAALTSTDRVLALGDEKHICEVDCHLAYSVARAGAQGTHYVVTVRVRFDATTTSPHRGMAPLTPNSRYVALVDGRGRRYAATGDGLRRPLVPGESYTTDLIFDLPSDARDLRLMLASGDIETPFLIGHENSFFHGKTTFRLTT
ncbi:MAG TPA: hypothetical protein VJN39_11340 [Gemmatimonadales bacterium]|nr:hypothetical protein [Gemmatimonadales bacterium]